MGDNLESSVGRGVSRRAMIQRAAAAGAVAWAAPVIVDSMASPAGALTLPPCISSITNVSQNWVVDNVEYPGCGLDCHRDIRLAFTVTSCDQDVYIGLTPISGRAQWCAWTNKTYEQVKMVPANTTGVLIFPNDGDVIPNPSGCTIVPHTPTAVDDGIHVNPCSSGPHIQWRVKYGASGTWSAYTGFTAPALTNCP